MATDDSHHNTPAATPLFDASLSQADFELEFYNQIIFRNGYHVDALRQLVELLAQRGDFGRALELDQRLVGLQPDDMIARYNLACTLSMLGRLDMALGALDAAFQLGYHDLAHLEVDADLESVRDHPDYPRLLKKHGLY